MRILLLVQNQVSRELISQCLIDCGHDVVTANTAEGLFDLLDIAPFQVVICDLEHETLGDEPLSARLMQHYPDLQIIITTPNLTTLNEAVSSLRNGGYSFLVKVFEDVGLLSASLNRAIDNVRVLTELRSRIEELQKRNLELAGLHRTLKNLESRDALTGLHSQLHFQEMLGKELIRSLQTRSPFSLLLMELRLFSEESDSDQPFTEEKLGQLARAIKERLRRSDLIVLYREQTFGILLPETSKEACRYVIPNLVELLERFFYASARACHFSKMIAYFGSANFPVDSAKISGLTTEAENDLSAARETGGVVIVQDRHAETDLPAAATVTFPNGADLPRRRILVVDDEESTCSLVGMTLANHGFTVDLAENGEEALAKFQDKSFPVVITDVVMPGMNGMALLKRLKSLQPETEVIIMTAHSSLNSSIDAMRSGAFDYLPKPIDDLEIVPILAQRAFDNYCRVTEKQKLIAELDRKNKGLAMANKTLQDMVIRDGLTGLYNHSYFKEAVEIEVVRSKRYRRHFALLFMDLDHFKHYNDTHGHPAGDQLLKTLSKQIGKRLRKSDILARYGGEEFTAILPEIDKDMALKIAEQIRHDIENYPFPGREFQPRGMMTITVGVAIFPADGHVAATLINSADQALYRGKCQGRNCVSL